MWLSEKVKFVNHKYDIWNCGSWPKTINLSRFGLKIAMCLIFMKLGTQNKLDMVIINIVIGIDDLDPKLQICEILSQNCSVLKFSLNLALRANGTCYLWINDFDPKLYIRVNVVPKLKCAPIFIKFGTLDIFKFLLIR